jgi:hypothetical protein
MNYGEFVLLPSMSIKMMATKHHQYGGKYVVRMCARPEAIIIYPENMSHECARSIMIRAEQKYVIKISVHSKYGGKYVARTCARSAAICPVKMQQECARNQYGGKYATINVEKVENDSVSVNVQYNTHYTLIAYLCNSVIRL